MSSASDAFTYQSAMSSQSTPNIFLRKEVLSINDNQNNVYSGNQAIIDTSQLSNSNKYLDYRNTRLLIPLLLTLSSDTVNKFDPDTAATCTPHGMGLRNWFGTIINSCQVELNGTTVTQQTNMTPIYNVMKLMTTLSWDDVKTQTKENANTLGLIIWLCPESSMFRFRRRNTTILYDTRDLINNLRPVARPCLLISSHIARFESTFFCILHFSSIETK